MLRGREPDQQAIDVLLDQARAGRSGVLVFKGEPGIGKTSLLSYAGERAHDMTVLRGLGIETEADLPYASLHLLLRGRLDCLDALPEPQAVALAGALGLAPTRTDDRFHVGVAVLSLLAELAEDRPLLCLVDDAHWLDEASARALCFAAHRLHAEGVVIVFGARDGFDPAGLPERRLAGLDDQSAAQVLADVAPELAGPARRRILQESAGNPLALRELPRTADVPAYDHSPLPLPERLRLAYADRIGRLPRPAQTALLVTALVDDGDLDRITNVCAGLGIEPAALGAAELAGLIRIAGRQAAFRHPLMRAAAFQLSTYDQRLEVHAVLARLLVDDPDRRAWHLAAAATGLDESVARALEETAHRARERGANVSACAAFERAAELSEDPELKGRRLLAAAVDATEEGQLHRAQQLLDAATGLVPDASARATLPTLRARIAFGQGAPRLAHELLLNGAADVADDDRAAAGLMLVEAARNAHRLGDADGIVAAATRLSRLDLRPQDDLDLARQTALSTAMLLTDGPATALPVMRELVANSSRITPGMHSRRINAAYFALQTGDFQTAWEIARAAADECRTAGEISKLAVLHITLATSEIFLGRFTDAIATASEGLHLTTETGRHSRAGCMQGMLAWIAAARGDVGRCTELAGGSLEQYDANGIVNGLAWAQWAQALLDLGQGRLAEALDRLDAAMAGPVRHQYQAVHFAPDQIEAAAHLGLPADEPLRRYEAWAQASGLAWAQAVLHRCRALLEPDSDRAESLFHTAVRLHSHGGRPWESARTALLYGERLRRERNKRAARVQLRAALEIFQRLDARPWAERARNELRAAGDTTLAVGAGDGLPALSPQELQIVRLAAAGRTNKEIGAQLFLSPKTVSYHLYRAFPKLNVTSRAQLAGLDLT
ncbi:LuxR C-terminal-related transcriptional regulator [Nonomuraea sp. NPDC005692]|uniref:helix-turn-helix transcriptional regulator n=1 Tax=Nonomuraea sp. NPDC005692 TaxID=3157168 RepID=UPI00340F941E